MPEQRTAKSPVWLKRLGGRIRQARRIRGFTQTDIARPNLTKSFISLLESGRTYPSVSTLVTLASRLQSSLALLLLETPQLPRETALNLLELARASAPANAAKTDRLLATVEALSEDANDLRAELLLTRGDIAVVQGRPRDAERAFSDALAWSRKNELRPFEPRALSRMAHLAFARHEEDAGRERLENALAQFRSTRTLRSAEGCKALLTYGELMSRQSRTARAQRILLEVAQAAQRQDLTLILGRAQLGLARIHLAAGRGPAAGAAPLEAGRGSARGIRGTVQANPADCRSRRGRKGTGHAAQRARGPRRGRRLPGHGDCHGTRNPQGHGVELPFDSLRSLPPTAWGTSTAPSPCALSPRERGKRIRPLAGPPTIFGGGGGTRTPKVGRSAPSSGGLIPRIARA